MRVILPCAGYGTRMGMLPDQSKEMLEHLNEDGKKIIDYSLNMCEEWGFDPLVVTRKEKKDLLEYISCDVKIIQPIGEWYDTVLLSQEDWADDNILMLPDTRFRPVDSALLQICNGLSLGSNAVFGVHQVKDPANWGVIKDYKIIDKPKNMDNTLQFAWGLIGFKKEYGVELFTNMTIPKKLKNTSFVYLSQFVDVTRSKW